MTIDLEKDFGMRDCPSCAVEVSSNQNRCPICGYEFPHPKPVKKTLFLWTGIILLLVIIYTFTKGIF